MSVLCLCHEMRLLICGFITIEQLLYKFRIIQRIPMNTHREFQNVRWYFVLRVHSRNSLFRCTKSSPQTLAHRRILWYTTEKSWRMPI